MSVKISRRNLFRLKPVDLVALLRRKEDEDQVRPIRPPGALANEDAFLSTCERCGACAEACPYDVIEKLGPMEGQAEGTPVLRPETNPCRWCADLPCVEACPSGALAFGPEKSVTPMARAQLTLETCLTSEGILCDTCALYCPPSVKAITMRNRQPHFNEEACVGCGLCAFYCESHPVSWSVRSC